MDTSRYGVHRTHCCVLHGCKYGDEDCPVANGEIKQDYTCESCSMDSIKKVEEIKYLLEFRNVSDKDLLDDLIGMCFKHVNLAFIPREELEERDKLENEVLRRMSKQY